MIRLEKFDPLVHRSLIIYWLSSRGLGAHLCDDLPKLGYVAYVDTLPIACAFIRMCEGSVAMIDGLVSNPFASSSDRHLAIDEIVCGLLTYARAKNIRQILSYSIDEGTIKRSESHGFVRLPHVLIGIDLGEENGLS